MRVSRTAKAVGTIAIAGTILGLGGLAVAAFVQETVSDAVSGSAEPFVPVTVVGSQTAKLLPGESADVTLTLTNPNTNVRARLIGIAAGEVVVDTVANADDLVYCHDQLNLSTAGAGAVLPTLDVGQANLPYVLTAAVTLLPDTDIRCQGMTFHTTWTAQFEAVR